LDSDVIETTAGLSDAATGSGSPNVISRYVSSTSSRAPARSTIATSSKSVASARTTPVGLCGVVTLTSLVRGVMRAATRAGSTAQPDS
jgi:hypothetical protein